jgi:hypothetical protein
MSYPLVISLELFKQGTPQTIFFAQDQQKDSEFLSLFFMTQVEKICNEEFPAGFWCFYYLSFEKSIK